MKLVGMMPVRNEEFCLGLSLRVALMWCDEVVVLLHACTDRSTEIALTIAREERDRVTVVGKDGEWTEMVHRQAMLELARARGATHLAIVDADEVLTGNLLKQSWQCWDGMIPTNGQITQLPGYNLRNGINSYHSNGVWGNRFFSVAFADDPRLSWSGDNFHAREPRGVPLKPYRPIQQGQGGILHLWASSPRRLRAKHNLYRLTEALRWPEKPRAEIERMYSWAERGEAGNAAYGTPETWTYAAVPEAWWSPYRDLMRYLDIDAVPWQEQACRDIIREHGPERFSGLTLLDWNE